MQKDTYIDKWLRRLRKEMAVSGRLSQLSLYLSCNSSESPEAWQTRVRNIIDGDQKASPDFVLAVDRWNATNKKSARPDNSDQMDLL